MSKLPRKRCYRKRYSPYVSECQVCRLRWYCKQGSKEPWPPVLYPKVERAIKRAVGKRGCEKKRLIEKAVKRSGESPNRVKTTLQRMKQRGMLVLSIKDKHWIYTLKEGVE